MWAEVEVDEEVADPGQRHRAVLHRELLVHEVAQRRVDDDRVEAEEPDVELAAEGHPQPLLGDEAQPDQHLAQGLPRAPLLSQGRLVVGRAQVAGLEQDVAELAAAPVTLENRQELVARDDLLRHEDVAERSVALARALHAQRLVELRGGHQPLGQEQLAESHGGDGFVGRGRSRPREYGLHGRRMLQGESHVGSRPIACEISRFGALPGGPTVIRLDDPWPRGDRSTMALARQSRLDGLAGVTQYLRSHREEDRA